MARKNPFAKLLNDDAKPADRTAVEYAAKGASRTILNTLDEMAARADQLAAGETIVELDPDLVDASFVRDRRTEDEKEFEELLEAIRENGQNSRFRSVLTRRRLGATWLFSATAASGSQRRSAARCGL